MARDLFTDAVERALDELPPELARHLDTLVVQVESEHADEPDLYGLYEGTPLTERTSDSMDGQLPSRVSIFRRPLTEDFGGPDSEPGELAREIRVTVLHEVGHHFGIDEHRLEQLGWA